MRRARSIRLATLPLMMNPTAVPGDLAAEDVRVDAPALRRRESSRRSATRSPDPAVAITAPRSTRRQQQRRVARGERAEERGDAPQDDGDREHRDPLDAVDEQAHRDREDRADEQRHRAQQADLRVADVQRMLELGRDGADRRVSAPLRASTPPNSVITRARAGPPTRLTTSPRTNRADQRAARFVNSQSSAATPRFSIHRQR